MQKQTFAERIEPSMFVPCSECEGTGKFTTRKEHRHYPAQWIKVVTNCEACKGSGLEREKV